MIHDRAAKKGRTRVVPAHRDQGPVVVFRDADQAPCQRGRRASPYCRRASVRYGVAFWALLACVPGCGNPELGPDHFPSLSAINAANAKYQDKTPVPVFDGPVRTALRFTDVTPRTGIDFAYRDGQEADFWTTLESVGGGAAAVDYDGDGDVDLICAGGGRFEPDGTIYGLALGAFRNEGEWRFTRVDGAAGLSSAPYYNHCVAAGDYDNDGFPDLLLTGYGGLVLYRNQGDGTFADNTIGAGLTEKVWSTGAAWGDLNGDGLPDLYIAHYVNWSFANHPRCGSGGQIDLCGPNPYEALPHTLYVNAGDGTFLDASRAAGLRTDGKGLGVLLADLDLDGRLDIYVANDGTPNFLYQNRGDLAFDEVGLQSGTSLNEQGGPDASMGLDVFDFNLDGQPDVWVTNFENESCALYQNLGDCLFRHVSRSTGIMAVGTLSVGWGTVATDFDRDGDEDLFVTNGHASRGPIHSTVLQLPIVFENLGEGRFADVASRAGGVLGTPHLGRGLAAGDFDDDGDLDLALVPINEPVLMLANEATTENHWLALKLVGVRSSRDAVGAIVRLETPSGAQVRQVKGGGSFASTGDSRVFFGLGSSEKASKLTIHWPSGLVQSFENVSCNRLVHIIETGAGPG